MQDTAEIAAKKKAFIEQYRLKMEAEAAAKALVPPPKKLKDIPQIVPFLPAEVDLERSDVNTLRYRWAIYGASTLWQWATQARASAVRSWSLSWKRREQFALLLENSADPNVRVSGVRTGSNNDHSTILMSTVRLHGHRIVALLLSYNADITIRDFFGNTVLDYAASCLRFGGPERIESLNLDLLNPSADFSKERRNVTGLFPLLSKIHTIVFDWNTPPSESLTIMIHQSIGHNNFTLDLAKIVAHYGQGPSLEEISGLLAKETPERLDLFRSYCRTAHERYTRSQREKAAITTVNANTAVAAVSATAIAASASAPRKSTNWSKVKRIFL